MAYRSFGRETVEIKGRHRLMPCDYYDILSTVWCADTCAPCMRDEWSEDNRTLGQCSITAFLMQDFFGGKVYGIPLGDGNFHCFNVVEESPATPCVFDLTSEQFGDRVLDYGNCQEQSRETHFARTEKRHRYEILRAETMKKIPELSS